MMKANCNWKQPTILLAALGISTLGDWIYLIALNLSLFTMTGSPFAVTVLYLLKPLATLCTNMWSGSLIDRIDQRMFIICLDVLRGIFVILLPFFTNLWMIYGLVFLINMATAMFEPSSLIYMTKVVPEPLRKRFNGIRTLLDSGGFVIGPAVAGLILMVSHSSTAIWVNGGSFILSAFLFIFLPSFPIKKELQYENKQVMKRLTGDWKEVLRFTEDSRFIMLLYSLFSLMMVMATAIDSLEAAFSKGVLHLSDDEYGFLVSLAGIGYVAGASINAIFAHRLNTVRMMGGGSLLVSCGYVLYSFSSSFTQAATGFILLSFFLAFAQTGFTTFLQQTIPIHLLGRVRSLYGWLEAVIVIAITCMMGAMAEYRSIQESVMVGCFIMLFITVPFYGLCLTKKQSASLSENRALH